MRFSWSHLAVLVAALLSSACSALINPDNNRLGDGVDAGPGGSFDGGPPPGTDGGPPPPPTDAGPPPRTDGGPIGRDGGPPPPMMDAGCTITPSCSDDAVTTCDGVEHCPLGCAPDGSARCAEMVPSNVEATHWRADARNVTIETADEPIFLDTDACTSMMSDSAIVRQGDGSEVCVLMVRDLIVRSYSGIVVFGSRPLIVMATGNFAIEPNGYVSVNARAEDAGPGGSAGGNSATRDGSGDHGGAGGENTGFSDGGGGGGGFCGAGGDGGRGGGAEGGPGGGRDGDVNLLIPLRGGSGGGMGFGGPGNPGRGGGGGGGLQISALGTITVDGYIGAGGSGGGGGLSSTMQWGSGGGGGSGGGVLLEAPTIIIGADSAITTSGGGGGGSASDRTDGAAGDEGGATLGRAVGGARGGPTFGANGGASGGGGNSNGRDGAGNSRNGGNGGGGGGGVGCVVYRTLDGSRPANAELRTSGTEGRSLLSARIMLR